MHVQKILKTNVFIVVLRMILKLPSQITHQRIIGIIGNQKKIDSPVIFAESLKLVKSKGNKVLLQSLTLALKLSMNQRWMLCYVIFELQ